jgi:hypothetical protein
LKTVHNPELYFGDAARGALKNGIAAGVAISVDSAPGLGELAAALGCGGTATARIRMKQAFGIDVPLTLTDVCDRSRLALVVYDMQVGIVSQLKGAEAVTARVARMLAASRRARMPAAPAMPTPRNAPARRRALPATPS